MAGMGKLKALQIWCKNRLLGYRDVEITNMTTSWRDGLAFCALIHRFRPDLIDYDSLSKENIFENNELAFGVAEELGVPALLDAEDMVRLQTPDKLSIITYVAQLHNYFRDKDPVGGPDIKTASKRHSTPVRRSVTMRSPESKRKPVAMKKHEPPMVLSTSSSADICIICDGKVYLIEKHIVDGKLYHRSCFKRNNRKTDTSGLTSTPKTPIEVRTPARPSVLSSNGLSSNILKKPSTSLPATPATPPDARPDWQRRIQEKSATPKPGSLDTSRVTPKPDSLDTSRVTPKAVSLDTCRVTPKVGLETLRVDSGGAAYNELSKVRLRSKPTSTAAARAPMPRAVSVGVDLDERISKLRQLRASAKASGSPNEAVKARLAKLQALVPGKDAPSRPDTQSPSKPSPRISLRDIAGKPANQTIDEREEEMNSSTTEPMSEEVERSRQEPERSPRDVPASTSASNSLADTHTVPDTPPSQGSETKPNDIVTHSSSEADNLNYIASLEVNKKMNSETVEADEPKSSVSSKIIGVIRTVDEPMGRTKTTDEPIGATKTTDEPIGATKTTDELICATKTADEPSNNPFEIGDNGEANPTSAVLDTSGSAAQFGMGETAPVPRESDSTGPQATKVTGTATTQAAGTPSAPTRSKRSHGTKAASRVARPRSPATAQADRKVEVEDTPQISPTRLPLSSLNIAVSANPANSRRRSNKDTPSSFLHGNNGVASTPVVVAGTIDTKVELRSAQSIATDTEVNASISSANGANDVTDGVAGANTADCISTAKSSDLSDAKNDSDVVTQLGDDMVTKPDNDVVTIPCDDVKKPTDDVVTRPDDDVVTKPNDDVVAKPDNDIVLKPSEDIVPKPSNVVNRHHADITTKVDIEMVSNDITAIPRNTTEDVVSAKTDDVIEDPPVANVAVVNANVKTCDAKSVKTGDVAENTAAQTGDVSSAYTSADGSTQNTDVTETVTNSKTSDVMSVKTDDVVENTAGVTGNVTYTKTSDVVSIEKEDVIGNVSAERVANIIPTTDDVSADNDEVIDATAKTDSNIAVETGGQTELFDSNKSEENSSSKPEDDIAGDVRLSSQESEHLDGESKLLKPSRPPVSPALARRLTSKGADDTHSAEVKPLEEMPAVVLRQEVGAKVPPRPKTVAAGSVSKSHFYMDEGHQKVIEPPPKPVRQSAILQTKAKDDWEGALENWSIKRKDKEQSSQSTWYSAESYPTEHNPFGEEDESREISNMIAEHNPFEEDDESTEKSNIIQNNGQPVMVTKAAYDVSLNPFGEEDTEKIGVSNSKDEVVAESHSNALLKKKLIPFNPFEVSDEEEEDHNAAVDRKKLIPDPGLSAEKKRKSTRQATRIVLPNANTKITPKRHAPLPPPTLEQVPPTSTQTPPISTQTYIPATDRGVTDTTQTVSNDTVVAQTTNENTPEKIISAHDSKFSEIGTNENTAPDTHKKKQKPAPPRPMPPKRRVQSEYGITPEDIAKELIAIDDKQRQLEDKGRLLEQAIRNADAAAAMGSEECATDDDTDDDLLSSWLDMINEKNHLVRRESELSFISKHHELETTQADIEWELRQIMHRAENLKTDDDKLREEDLLQKLVTVVHERSKLVDKMDDERLRQQEEDREIHLVLGAKKGQGAGKSQTSTATDSKKAEKKAEKKKNKKDKKSK